MQQPSNGGPTTWAATKPDTLAGAMPAKVSLNMRPEVTAGLANEPSSLEFGSYRPQAQQLACQPLTTALLPHNLSSVSIRAKIAPSTRCQEIGRRFSNIVCKKADVDMDKRAGKSILSPLFSRARYVICCSGRNLSPS